MFESFARKGIEKFEREWDYDASYMRDILDAGGMPAIMAVQGVQKMAQYREDIPPGPYYAAGIASVQRADCGPCTQLGVRMAERAGVSPEVLRAVLQSDVDALPPDERLAYEFAIATLEHAAIAGELRARIVERWGERGLVSLAFTITAGQIWPTLKYALGHGQACVRVRVGETELTASAASRPT